MHGIQATHLHSNLMLKTATGLKQTRSHKNIEQYRDHSAFPSLPVVSEHSFELHHRSIKTGRWSILSKTNAIII